MNSFVQSASNPVTVTENGAVAFSNTSDALVDAFFQLPASRANGESSQTELFEAALRQNPELALRLALWLRDVRGGAGERATFRTILKWLDKNTPELVARIAHKIPEVGRWDDLLVLERNQSVAFSLIQAALNEGNALCAKWMPREKSSGRKLAVKLRQFMGLTPRQYRKKLVDATNVVETKMCAGQWKDINFSHVPSRALSLYKDAFERHDTERFSKWVNAAVVGDVKVNASAIFPQDVIKDLEYSQGIAVDAMFAQWNALPNYMNGSRVLPVIDVSGSMTCSVGGSADGVSCMHAAISLGLYCASKNQGDFKNVVSTFSAQPNLVKIDEITDGASLKRAYTKTKGLDWGMTTNLDLTFVHILDHARRHNVPNEDMPTTVVIFSDMQFDECGVLTGLDMIRENYARSGYTVPNIVFWNLRSTSNAPAKFNEHGVALVGGFSPAVFDSVLSGELRPDRVMMNTLMRPRYNV